MKTLFRRLFQNPIVMDYGMLLVLILVCICLSWATMREGEILGGIEGGRQLAALAADTVPQGQFIVIAPPEDEESIDLPDLDTVVETLRERGCAVVAILPHLAARAAFLDQTRELCDERPDISGFVLVNPARERWLQGVLRGRDAKGTLKIILPVHSRESVFLKPENLVNVVRQASGIAIIAAGMTMVIITGGIDLSVGSLVALSGVVTALCLKQAGGIPTWAVVSLVLVCGSMGSLGLGIAFGGRGRWLLIGLAVSGAVAYGLGHLAHSRVLGIKYSVPDTVQALAAAAKENGTVFLFYDGDKPGAKGLTEQIREKLEAQTGIKVVGEQSVAATESDTPTESVETRAKMAAQQVLSAHPDVQVLFGTDRDIHSGLNRAIDAEGATERLAAVNVVTDKKGLILFGVLVGILVGCLAGAMSGAVITGFSIPPFIATLAMMLIAKGMARYICGGVPVWDLGDDFGFLGTGYLFEGIVGAILPVPVIILLVVYFVGHFILSHTRFGRYLYAVGGNEEATRLSGIPINAVKLAAYVITGGLSAIAGVIIAARLNCGHPETGGLYELYVIAACVVGGASLMGGQGKILGSLIGALLIWVIFNGLNLLNVDSYLQQAILGLVIFIAVLLDQAKKRFSG
ncbi:MAG: hypothetical protein ABIH23_02310 [bacterium]